MHAAFEMKEQNDFRLPVARTAEGIAYEKWFKRTKALASHPDFKADWDQANADIISMKMSPGVPHFDAVLQNMSVQFKNDDYIVDQLLPRIFTNGQLGGQFFVYDKRDSTAYPDDAVAPDGTVNEIGRNRTRDAYALQPRSMREKLDSFTIQNQTKPLNELMDAQANALEGMAFNHEVRGATIIGTAGNYAGNTVAIAAADRWDTSTGGDPGAVMDTARAATWSGRGPGRWVLATSLNVYNVLKRHPKILDTFKYGGGAPPFATRQMLAEYFEVDEVLVGKARKDTGNILQSASYSRIWPDVVALLRVAASPSLQNAAFGYTFQDNPTRQTMWFDGSQGGDGCYITRATHADQEKVVAASCGYLVTTPIG